MTKLTFLEIKRRIQEDPDFVFLKRFDYSLQKLLERYPEGCPERIIANALMLTEEDIDILYDKLVIKLRNSMGIVL